jgi:hypothetical protein
MLRKTAGALLRTREVPPLEMQPLVPGLAVPGAPVLVLVRKSTVVSHLVVALDQHRTGNR